jgi:GNAT superfamily N-acetyltransferase
MASSSSSSSVILFTPGQHTPLIPYLAAIHASCITHDRTIASFIPPLSHEKLLAYWKDRIAEVSAGTRLLLLLVRADDSDPASSNGLLDHHHHHHPAVPKGTNLVGIVMLDMPPSETSSLRAVVEKLLVHPSYRARGGATALVDALEREAVKRGRTMLVSDFFFPLLPFCPPRVRLRTSRA